LKTKLECVVALAIWSCTWASFSAESRQILFGHVPGAISQLQLRPLGRLAATNRLNLALALPLRNQAALGELLHRLYDPASSEYHHFLTPDEFTDRFGPAESDYQALAAEARACGLVVTGTHRTRTLLDVSGTVSQIEHAFRVTLRTYRHPTESRLFYAPDTEPSVALHVPVLSIGGLDNYVLPHPLSHPVATHPTRAEPQTGSAPGGYYMGSDFRGAYAPGVTLTGAGQSLGLLEV
jgi:subtilase family serine protease